MRTETDSLGPVEVPEERLWGAQTQRALSHFAVSTEAMPPELLRALALVKKAAAAVNAELGGLSPEKARAIEAAADEVLAGAHGAEFPLRVWQTGSGTQSNMNMNEVLANRASELLGGPRGAGRRVHPNDDVNRSQSSNDVFPSALQLAALEAVLRRVRPAAVALRGALAAKAEAFRAVVKLGRTHLQDAVPMTVGQELGAFAAQLERALAALDAAQPGLGELALGGTAVGTGLNAPLGYAERIAQVLAGLSGLPLTSAPDKFAALAAADALVQAHGALKLLATVLFKLANDVRLLASGPRAGLGEYLLPENEPGSSIMPGKVNPTQCEMLAMVAVQVLANDVAVGFAGASGPLQLNMYRPLLAHAFLQSCRLLADGMDRFREHLVEGLQVDQARIAQNLQRSLMLATALSPHLGYDVAAEVARKAHREGSSLKDAALALGVATAAQLEEWLAPETMLGPRRR